MSPPPGVETNSTDDRGLRTFSIWTFSDPNQMDQMMRIHQGTSFVSMLCIMGTCHVSSITPAIPTSRFIPLLKMGTIEFTILPCSPFEQSNRTKSFVLITKVKKRSKSRPDAFVQRRIAVVGYLEIEEHWIGELPVAGGVL